MSKPIRVLYSFPHRLGSDRICYTAWEQVNWVSSAGADMLVFPGVLSRPVFEGIRVRQTLARGKARISYKLFGRERALALHDYIVSRRLSKLRGKIDIVHVWPQSALRTLRVASDLGIPTVLERCNAHTRYAMNVVKQECERLGIKMARDHEHAENPEKLRVENEEYVLADRLLCPSDFVARTFIEEGFPQEKLVRHQYGYDEKRYSPRTETKNNGGLTMLFVGGCAPRKGLHYALEAWLASPAHNNGKFLIAGAFIPGYEERLASMLAHPSVKVLGHRSDVADLMRQSDILVLPTIEEGSALVTYEARGSGCVLLVSDAAGAVCEHMVNALVHPAGNVEKLREHLTMLYERPDLLEKLRSASLNTLGEITWKAAGAKLLDAYQETVDDYQRSRIDRTRSDSQARQIVVSS